MKFNYGFSFLELLVLIVFLGAMAVIGIYLLNPSKRFNQAKDQKIKSDIGQIALAVQAYNSAKQIYPENAAIDLVKNDDLKFWPTPPEGSAYNYLRSTPCSINSCEARLFAPLFDPKIPGSGWCWQSETGQFKETAGRDCTF